MSIRIASFLIALILLFPHKIYPEIIDRVVAYVDDYAITMYDLQEAKKEFMQNNIEIDFQALIDSVINKILLVKEAKKMRLDTSDTKDPIKEYIDIKIRSLIFIKDEDIHRFYSENKDRFEELPLSSVKDKIEQYLTEQEVNKQLKQHIAELRQKSNIVINLKQSDLIR